MRVLLCNNFVRNGSGIDAVVRLEEACLSEAGHDVRVFSRDNRVFDDIGSLRALWLSAGALYGASVLRDLDRQLSESRYDVVHVHNTVPLLTGAVYDAVRRHPEVALLQSLHNYRAACLNSYLYRKGAACRVCVDYGHIGCLVHRCYAGSFTRSAALGIARAIDRVRGRRYGMDADHYVAVSPCVRDHHVQFGMAPGQISVLPNAAADLGRRTADPRPKLVYVGALIKAKGVDRLPGLARDLPNIEFHVIGSGDMEARLREEGASSANLHLHGYCDRPTTRRIWQDAQFTLVPSMWDEPFGLTAIESFSLGIPVITTGAGALGEIVTADRNGCIAPRVSSSAIEAAIRRYPRDSAGYAAMCKAARDTFEAQYSREIYAARLESVLSQCLDAHRAGPDHV